MSKQKQLVEVEWRNNGGNYVLGGNKFYISYNPDTGAGHMAGMLTQLGNMFGGDLTDGEETALCKDDVFLILTGDFRKEYEELLPHGYEACHEFYLKMAPEHGNSWSTQTPEGGKEANE